MNVESVILYTVSLSSTGNLIAAVIFGSLAGCLSLGILVGVITYISMVLDPKSWAQGAANRMIGWLVLMGLFDVALIITSMEFSKAVL